MAFRSLLRSGALLSRTPRSSSAATFAFGRSSHATPLPSKFSAGLGVGFFGHNPFSGGAARSLTTEAPAGDGKPTRETATAMQRNYFEFSNEVLLILSAHNDRGAQQERMLRDIMAVDNVEWEAAHMKLAEINEVNRRGKFIDHLPYKTGTALALVMGFASIPLCFEVNSAMWFNDVMVTTDIPPPEDLETVLETGMWTWGWMEPPLGQLSFLLLCLQFARAQLDNIGVRPYNGHLIIKRKKRLQEKFPMYNDNILADFSEQLDVVSAQPEVAARSDEWGDGR